MTSGYLIPSLCVDLRWVFVCIKFHGIQIGKLPLILSFDQWGNWSLEQFGG